MSDKDLVEWQKRQIDRCCVENIINQVIEAVNLLRGDSTEMTYYDEHCQDLEESAILMAIDSHGLQQYRAGTVPAGQRIANRNDVYNFVNNDHLSVMESAVSLAIQTQGLGVMAPNR